MQRANEERKLEDRLSTADKLDELAQRNGNANLHDTAARKRDKARELYEKRLAKIDSKDPSSFPTDEVGRFGGGLDSWDSDDLVGRNDLFGDNPFAPQNLAGRENALFRQLQNEQRQLASRMDVADRLWDAFDQTGDTWLADAAQAFEDRALAQFEKRMDAISAFQQRHGLSDVSLQEPAPARPAITR
jgi:hypothetical protein